VELSFFSHWNQFYDIFSGNDKQSGTAEKEQDYLRATTFSKEGKTSFGVSGEII